MCAHILFTDTWIFVVIFCSRIKVENKIPLAQSFSEFPVDKPHSSALSQVHHYCPEQVPYLNAEKTFLQDINELPGFLNLSKAAE